jgi:uncharacterized protein
MVQAPTAAAQALLALDFVLGPTREVAIVEGTAPEETAAVLARLHEALIPNKLVVRKSATDADAELSPALRPLLKGKVSRGGRTTIYVCNHGSCGLPVVGVEGLSAAIS